MSLLDATPDFESDDPVLHALLGLLSTGNEVRAFADRALAEAPAETSAPVPGVEDDLLHALLGALCLHKKMTALAASWAVEEPVSTSLTSLTQEDGALLSGEIWR
ncbi:MAG: hypothetical protein ABI193_04730 [Minicystis sp.]